MRQALCIVGTLLVGSSSLAENLIRNGDFERGSGGWDGDERVDFEIPGKQNHVCRIRLRNDDQEFGQEIKSRNLKDLNLSFRVRKSDDYSGRGYIVRFTRNDGSSVFYDFNELDTQWRTEKLNFSSINESKELLISFEIKSGESGYIEFDDIIATGSE